jgi:hypothetical protein
MNVLVFILGVLIGYCIPSLIHRKSKSRTKSTNIMVLNKRKIGRDEEIVIQWSDGKQYKFFGGGTVWFFADSGKRAGTSIECKICEAMALYRYKENLRLSGVVNERN